MRKPSIILPVDGFFGFFAGVAYFDVELAFGGRVGVAGQDAADLLDAAYDLLP